MQDMNQYRGAIKTRPESNVKLDDHCKHSNNQSLKDKIIGSGKLQSKCIAFYDLTNDSLITTEKMSRYRKTQESYRNRNEKNVRLQNTVSTFTTWTRYDEKKQRFTKYSPRTDSNSEAEASESSFSKELRDFCTAVKASVKMDQSSRSSEEKVYKRDIPERYRSSFYERHSKSPFRKTPPRYYDGKAVTSKTRYSRSRNRYRRSFSNERGDKVTKRSKRSCIRRRSAGRYRRFYEPGDKTAKRSRSVRKRGTDKHRYSSERDEKRPRSRHGSRSRSRRYQRSCCFEKGDKLKKNRRRSRSNSSSESSDESSERSKSHNQSRAHDDRSEKSLNNSNPQSYANQWQDGWNIGVGSSSESSSNSDNSVLDPNRKKIQFTLTKPLNTESNNSHTTTPTFSDIKSKLSALITSALNDRNNPGRITSNESSKPSQNIEYNFWQQNEESVQYNIASTSSTKENSKNTETTIKSKEASPIDEDIIRKIILQSSKGPTEKLPSKLPFDSVKQTVSKAESLENRHASTKDVQRYAAMMNGTTRWVHTDHSRLPEIQSYRIQPDQQSQSYCPQSGSKCMHAHCNPSTAAQWTAAPSTAAPSIAAPSIAAPSIAAPSIAAPSIAAPSIAAPVLTTANQNLLPPIFTPTSIPTPMNPISSLKSIPKTPALPHRVNQSKPNHFKPPLIGNINRKNTCKNATDHRSTVNSKTHLAPMYYGEYKRQSMNWNYKIPKKTTPTKRSASVALVDECNRQVTEESMGVQENYYNGSESYNSQPTSRSDENDNNYNDNQSTENQNTSNTGDNPSTEENTIRMLKELMSTDQFVTLVDLMGMMTQHTTLTKIQEVLEKDDTNEEGREILTTTSSDKNNITATVVSHESVSTRKQNTKTTPMRSRSPNATSTHHETSIDNLTTKNSEISHQRMEKSSVIEKPTFKNINPEFHSLKKVVSCQVCNKPPGNSLVNHYVNDHANSEVLVSRLAPEAAECLRSQEGIDKCKITRLPGSPVYQYYQFCFFCNVYKSFGRIAWIIHMTRHTGYYRFKCNNCSRLFAAKPQKNRCNSICKNNFEKIPQPQLHKKDVKAYVCNLCNYVRFHKKEMEKHLTNEHEDDSKKFTEHTFLNFPEKNSKCKSKNKSSLVDFIVNSESEYETVTESESESDLENELESDWVSEDGADENDETDLETYEMDLETYEMDFENDETDIVVPALLNESENTE